MQAHAHVPQCSVICTLVLLACWGCLCSGLPVLRLAGPADLPCNVGTTVTIQSIAADPRCGPSMTSWAVTLESGQNVQRGTEVYLGDLAAAEGPLELTVNTSSSEFFINSSKRLQRFEGGPGMNLGVHRSSLLFTNFCQASASLWLTTNKTVITTITAHITCSNAAKQESQTAAESGVTCQCVLCQCTTINRLIARCCMLICRLYCCCFARHSASLRHIPCADDDTLCNLRASAGRDTVHCQPLPCTSPGQLPAAGLRQCNRAGQAQAVATA